MSIPVALERLRSAVEERGGHAYVLTVSDEGRPHAVHGPVRWEGNGLVADVGRRSAANAAVRPSVSLLFSVRGDADYSLIVDGTATVEGHQLRLTPTGAVLHRPAPAPDPATAACASDCAPLIPRSKG
jgi:hypothetical protein